MRKMIKVRKALKAIIQYFKDTSRFSILSKIAPLRPQVINYPVTDRCNSKCIMCNVWKNNDGQDMTVEELTTILKNPLFKQVKSVGLSGGEPTLRDDLGNIAKTILTTLPKIKGISIITNGLQPDQVEAKINELSNLCREMDKTFSVMISIDGIDDIHSEVRGVSRAFERTNRTIELLRKNKDINLALCCTVTNRNVYELNRILNYAKSKDLYIKFRMATSIDRLYNESCGENYKLDHDQKQAAGQFVEKLAMTYEQDWERILFYKSLRKMLTENGKRTSPCIWQKDGITLDAKGNVCYCAVKSKILGNAKVQPANKLYFNKVNLNYRKNIVKEDCQTCVHDYTTRFTSTLSREMKDRAYRKLISQPVKMHLLRPMINLYSKLVKKDRLKRKSKLNNIMIIGWYGTETTGDKAILGGIIKDIYKTFGPVHITVTSYHSFYTLRTLEEIHAPGVKVVAINKKEFRSAWKIADLVMMGGGPLMEIEDVLDVLKIIAQSHMAQKTTMLYGVGVGPLNSRRLTQAVKNIVDLADIVTVRDKDSLELLKTMGVSKDIKVGVDPAISYLLEYKMRKPKSSDNLRKVGISLRVLPRNYVSAYSEDEYNGHKLSQYNIYNKIIEYLVDKEGVTVTLIPMNTFYVGDDDRDLLESLAEGFGKKVRVLEGTGSPDAVANEIANQDLFIGMRFHSVVFAAVLGVPVIAIDYTLGKGKISGFMDMINSNDQIIDIDELKDVQQLIDKVTKLKNHLREKSIELIGKEQFLKDKNGVPIKALKEWFELSAVGTI